MITPNDFFDAIYFINLNKRTDRRENMEKRLAKLGIEAIRVPAFDAAIIERTPNQCLIDVNTMILRSAHEKELSNILILEDDCLFHKDFNISFHEHVMSMPHDCDVWYLGGICDVETKRNYRINTFFSTGNSVYGTHAVAYGRSSFKKVAKAWMENYDYPIDCTLTERTDVNKLISVMPVLCVQDNTASDIPTSSKIGREYDETIYI